MTAPREEFELWDARLRMVTEPPPALVVSVAWESDGEVTCINVWDSPEAIADFFSSGCNLSLRPRVRRRKSLNDLATQSERTFAGAADRLRDAAEDRGARRPFALPDAPIGEPTVATGSSELAHGVHRSLQPANAVRHRRQPLPPGYVRIVDKIAADELSSLPGRGVTAGARGVSRDGLSSREESP